MYRKIAVAIMFVLTVVAHGNVQANEDCPYKTCDPNFIDRPTNGHPEPILGLNVPLENMMNFMCEHYYVVINPEACVDGLRGCVMDQMSRRIFEPNLTEEERAFNALVRCVVGK